MMVGVIYTQHLKKNYHPVKLILFFFSVSAKQSFSQFLFRETRKAHDTAACQIADN